MVGKRPPVVTIADRLGWVARALPCMAEELPPLKVAWLFTGKRLPGLLDVWFGPPRKTADVNLFGSSQRQMLAHLQNRTT
jgi:hypothetical protein